MMSIEDFLQEKRDKIIKKWRDAIVASYPSETRAFLKREQDQFSNPVGLIIVNEIERLFDALVNGSHKHEISSSLDKIIKVRAVQDFSPSDALAFIFQLKDIIIIELERAGSSLDGLKETGDVFGRIDRVALLAFDVYMECRQKLNDIRVHEVKNEVGRLLERANQLHHAPPQ
jgi:hypothetical protein